MGGGRGGGGIPKGVPTIDWKVTNNEQGYDASRCWSERKKRLYETRQKLEIAKEGAYCQEEEGAGSFQAEEVSEGSDQEEVGEAALAFLGASVVAEVGAWEVEHGRRSPEAGEGENLNREGAIAISFKVKEFPQRGSLREKLKEIEGRRKPTMR